MGIFARTFVIVNRIFGVGALIGGIAVFLLGLIRLWRIGPDETFWMVLGFGLLSIFAGYLYLTAPLSRSEMKHEKSKH